GGFESSSPSLTRDLVEILTAGNPASNKADARSESSSRQIASAPTTSPNPDTSGNTGFSASRELTHRVLPPPIASTESTACASPIFLRRRSRASTTGESGSQ